VAPRAGSSTHCEQALYHSRVLYPRSCYLRSLSLETCLLKHDERDVTASRRAILVFSKVVNLDKSRKRTVEAVNSICCGLGVAQPSPGMSGPIFLNVVWRRDIRCDALLWLAHRCVADQDDSSRQTRCGRSYVVVWQTPGDALLRVAVSEEELPTTSPATMHCRPSNLGECSARRGEPGENGDLCRSDESRASPCNRRVHKVTDSQMFWCAQCAQSPTASSPDVDRKQPGPRAGASHRALINHRRPSS
jgi:hypothetical protein